VLPSCLRDYFFFPPPVIRVSRVEKVQGADPSLGRHCAACICIDPRQRQSAGRENRLIASPPTDYRPAIRSFLAVGKKCLYVRRVLSLRRLVALGYECQKGGTPGRDEGPLPVPPAAVVRFGLRQC